MGQPICPPIPLFRTMRVADDKLLPFSSISNPSDDIFLQNEIQMRERKPNMKLYSITYQVQKHDLICVYKTPNSRVQTLQNSSQGVFIAGV